MGQLFYKGAEGPIEIGDRALAHLRLVFMTKLRRGEPFMFVTTSPHGSWPREFWIHPSLPLHFRFAGSRPPQINPRWINALMDGASNGSLRLLHEPAG